MNGALCLRCGKFKPSLWRACPACGYQPANDRDLAVSLLASGDCASEEQLHALAAQIERGEAPAFDPAYIEFAEEDLAKRPPFDASAVLHRIREAFVHEPRPEHFTDYKHCGECAEHDEMLRSYTPDTITEVQVGHGGWDPICFVTPDGYRYYLPGLARLVIETRGEYLDQFLFHLRHDRIATFTPQQRAAVAAFIEAIATAWPEVQDESPRGYDLLNVVEWLQNEN